MKNVLIIFLFFMSGRIALAQNVMGDATHPNGFQSSIAFSGPIEKEDIITEIARVSAYFSIKEKGIKVYPNPTEGELNIEFETATGTETIEILDLLANKVLEMRYEKTIDIGFLNRGIYFLRLLDKNDRLIIIERIVKK